MKKGLRTILWVIDENMGTNLQAQAFLHRLSENTTIKFCKWDFFFFFIIRAGRLQVEQGASQYGQGAAPSEIGLAGTLQASN